jgi:hypothetical protein
MGKVALLGVLTKIIYFTPFGFVQMGRSPRKHLSPNSSIGKGGEDGQQLIIFNLYKTYWRSV